MTVTEFVKSQTLDGYIFRNTTPIGAVVSESEASRRALQPMQKVFCHLVGAIRYHPK